MFVITSIVPSSVSAVASHERVRIGVPLGTAEAVDDLRRDREDDDSAGDDRGVGAVEIDENPDGGVRPSAIAETAARIPTPAMIGSPRILIGRSRSGCERRSLIAAANMNTYMPM